MSVAVFAGTAAFCGTGTTIMGAGVAMTLVQHGRSRLAQTRHLWAGLPAAPSSLLPARWLLVLSLGWLLIRMPLADVPRMSLHGSDHLAHVSLLTHHSVRLTQTAAHPLQDACAGRERGPQAEAATRTAFDGSPTCLAASGAAAHGTRGPPRPGTTRG